MKNLKIIVCLALTLFISITMLTAQQQEPLPPKNFNATVEQTNAGPSVKITWSANEEGVTPNIYTIYSTFGDQEKLIINAQVKHDPNKRDYEFFLHNLAPGVYNFFMKAGIQMAGLMIESEKTETITLTIEFNRNAFQFASKPITSAFIGGKYVYGMKVYSSYDCKIGFELLEAPEGMIIEGNNIIWEPAAVGEYKVHVRAFLVDCEQQAETGQEFIIRVTDGSNGKLYVKILMEDKGFNLKLGETMTYQFRYETNGNCPVIFEFQGELPEGFQFDKSGTFVFSPVREGQFPLAVKAYLECQPEVHAFRQFVITVGEGQTDKPKHCAYIKGSVSYDDNTPVPEGVVSAWKLDRNSASNKDMALFRSEIKEGQYSINVPEGNFALDITGKTFYPEWYVDAEFVTDAERITVACEDELEINAFVTPLPVPETYNVSGKVYDATTNEPVYAQVEFIPVQNLFEDSRNDKNHSFVTKTDDAGNYTIQLPDNFEYIARAVSAMNSKWYLELYYEDATNPMEADIIELTGDLRDINFAMKKHEEANTGGFAGKVVNKDNEPLKAKVIAHCLKPKNHYFKEVNTVFTTETDDAGSFKFEKLIPGEYVVMSIPLVKDYVPGYYKENDFVVLKWKEGTIITVDDAMLDVIYEIRHRLRGELGLAQIGGKIINSGGGRIEKQTEKSQNSLPVAGAFVYILDETGSVSDYGYTNSYGEFDLKEVSVGNLSLIADKVGFDSYESQIQTDFDKNSKVNLEFGMNESPVRVDDSKVNLFNADLYPTPAGKTVTLRFTSELQTKAQIAVINTLGTELYRTSLEAVKGENITKLNTSEFVSGIYFVQITIDGKSQTLPLQVVR